MLLLLLLSSLSANWDSLNKNIMINSCLRNDEKNYFVCSCVIGEFEKKYTIEEVLLLKQSKEAKFNSIQEQYIYSCLKKKEKLLKD